MDYSGLVINKSGGKVRILKTDGSIVLQAHLVNPGLYEANVTIALHPSAQPHVAFAVCTGQSFDLWHCRLGHIHEGTLHYMARHDLVIGLDMKLSDSLGPCDRCAKSKHHQSPFSKQATHALSIMNKLHTDLQGPFNMSTAGYHYVFAIIDDHSHMGWKRYFKTKDKTMDEIIALVGELKMQTGLKLKAIHADGGGEFVNAKLESWVKKRGIRFEISTPDVHQQNSVAEQFNQTTHEHSLAMRKDTNLSDGFWLEAHQYVNYMWNQCLTNALSHTTPYKVSYGKKPNISTLCIFGS
jgi:transposase InsO family protein